LSINFDAGTATHVLYSVSSVAEKKAGLMQALIESRAQEKKQRRVKNLLPLPL
jgi:hypothetical protein